MEGYQVGKDISAMVAVISGHTNELKAIGLIMQQTRDMLEDFAKIEGLEYDHKIKKWKRVEPTLMTPDQDFKP